MDNVHENWTPNPEKPCLMLVEGSTTKAVVEHFFVAGKRPKVDLLNFGSVNNLKNVMKLIASRISGNITAVGVIRDAEQNADAAMNSILGAFGAAKLSAPRQSGHVGDGSPRTGFLLLPAGKQTGCLEHALLDAYSGPPVMLQCADSFLQCVQTKAPNQRNANWQAKARVHALIAVSEKPEHSLATSAIAQQLWDGEAQSLRVIGEFLDRLCDHPKAPL